MTDFDARHGEAVVVSDLVRRITANNPGPYTYMGTCTYLVGRGDVAVIDPGPDQPEHVEAILTALEPNESISHLVVTHTHSDHSPAAVPLKSRTGASTYGFGPQMRLDDPDTTKFVFEDPEANPKPEPGKKPSQRVDQEFRPDVVLRDGDVVEGNGWSLEVVHTPGHASNHLCYQIREEATLVSGDHVMGWSTSVIPPPDGSLTEYMASLEALLGRSGDLRYLPAHGPPIEDPHPYVEALIHHRGDRTRQILDALDSGPSTIVDLVPRLYGETPKKLWPAAAASMYAHVRSLCDDGLLVVDGDPPLVRTSRIKRV